MEYKFDQLKVENLNGTLNIGLNPFSAKGQQIEDFQVDTETLKVNPETDTNPDFYQSILQEMHRYLDEEAYNRILHFEQEERTPLDEMYRQMMVDDIKNRWSIDSLITYHKRNHMKGFQQIQIIYEISLFKL